jgi:8-oxo-dGTP pyrophosphatase MutT (NUDIX family)
MKEKKKDKWLEIKKKEVPGFTDYSYCREIHCDGKKIVILPYKITGPDIKFILRHELTPCWNDEKNTISSLTGSVENNNILETAVIELKEEAGYLVSEEKMVYLGHVFGSKSMDTIYHIYTVDLTNVENIGATGDGGFSETISSCFWTKNVNLSKDPLVYAAAIKTLIYLKKIGLKCKII